MNWDTMTIVWGLPQYLAVIILIQRIIENFHGAYNMKRLLARGGREVGQHYYMFVPVIHVTWVLALFFLIPPDAAPIWWLLGVYGLLQVARYYVIFSLGPYWTTRTITLDDAPAVKSGPYSLFRHPNYAVVLAEVLVMPLAFGAWEVALGWGAAHVVMLGCRIYTEEKTLAPRRARS
jgi:methyltransferase